jgi:hypothetical protein
MKFLSSEAEVDVEATIRAMLASQQMDETQAYLTRGRSHERMANESLTAAWVNAFKAFVQSQNQSDLMNVNDLDAEIRLRESTARLRKFKRR